MHTKYIQQYDIMDFEYCENTFKILDYWKKRITFQQQDDTNNVEAKMGFCGKRAYSASNDLLAKRDFHLINQKNSSKKMGCRPFINDVNYFFDIFDPSLPPCHPFYQIGLFCSRLLANHPSPQSGSCHNSFMDGPLDKQIYFHLKKTS